MEIVSLEDFFRRTLGGRPNRMVVDIYNGVKFECACGQYHHFDLSLTPPVRELPRMRLVLPCPDDKGLTCVKIRGFFRFRFVSLIGVRDVKSLEQIDHAWFAREIPGPLGIDED